MQIQSRQAQLKKPRDYPPVIRQRFKDICRNSDPGTFSARSDNQIYYRHWHEVWLIEMRLPQHHKRQSQITWRQTPNERAATL